MPDSDGRSGCEKDKGAKRFLGLFAFGICPLGRRSIVKVALMVVGGLSQLKLEVESAGESAIGGW